MAVLTNPIDKQNIVNRFSDYVVATANAGISWGTNALPFSQCDFTQIFGGTTAGKTIGITGTNIPAGTNGEIVAQDIYNTLLAETRLYTRIRNVRCVLNVTGGGGNTGSLPGAAGVRIDQTAVAHLTATYDQTIASTSLSDLAATNVITSSGLELLFDGMRSAYNTSRAVSAGTFTTTVCHASCHSSCHSSRGRR